MLWNSGTSLMCMGLRLYSKEQYFCMWHIKKLKRQRVAMDLKSQMGAMADLELLWSEWGLLAFISKVSLSHLFALLWTFDSALSPIWTSRQSSQQSRHGVLVFWWFWPSYACSKIGWAFDFSRQAEFISNQCMSHASSPQQLERVLFACNRRGLCSWRKQQRIHTRYSWDNNLQTGYGVSEDSQHA